MNDLTHREKIALICAAISPRWEDYLTVKSMPGKTLRQIDEETRFGLSFINKCRKIAAKNSI